jgi:hypothetical protein
MRRSQTTSENFETSADCTQSIDLRLCKTAQAWHVLVSNFFLSNGLLSSCTFDRASSSPPGLQTNQLLGNQRRVPAKQL